MLMILAFVSKRISRYVAGTTEKIKSVKTCSNLITFTFM
jgi:hypothetical protein